MIRSVYMAYKGLLKRIQTEILSELVIPESINELSTRGWAEYELK